MSLDFRVNPDFVLSKVVFPIRRIKGWEEETFIRRLVFETLLLVGLF